MATARFIVEIEIPDTGTLQEQRDTAHRIMDLMANAAADAGEVQAGDICTQLEGILTEG